MANRRAIKYTSKTMTDIIDESRDKSSFTYEELKCKYDAALRTIKKYESAFSERNFIFKAKRSDDGSDIESYSLLTITPAGEGKAHFYFSMPNTSCSYATDTNGNITKVHGMFKEVVADTMLILPEVK